MAHMQEFPEQLPSTPTAPPRPWGKLIPNRLWSSWQTGMTWYRQTTHHLTDHWQSWQDNRQGRTQAQAWLSSLVWYRVRYGSAELAEQGLTVLAGATGCGRVALVYQPWPLPQLVLGLPPAEGEWGQRVARDYEISLYPVETPESLTAWRVASATKVEWQRPFLAYLVNEHLFLAYLDEAEPAQGLFWPGLPGLRPGQPRTGWQLPVTPPVGLTTRPHLAAAAVPDELKVTGQEKHRWLLGYAPGNQMIQAPTPQVNLYGSREAVTLWLEQATLAALARQPEGLVIIDGHGTLTQRLKRHVLVADLLNRKQLTLASVTEASGGRTGFNPLAPVPGETETQTVERWQTWFADMGCGGQARVLLAEAYAEGVRDINQLRHWLAQPARLFTSGNGLISLQTTLHRLFAEAAVRDWLEWPTNLFATGAERALLSTCPGEAWGQKQLLKALLLGFQAIDQTRLILTGIDKFNISPAHFVLVANGARLPQTTPIMTTMPDKLARELLARFKPKQNGDRLSEQIQLLAPGEGVVLTQSCPVTVSFAGAVTQAKGLKK
jgi:hypothetical protein